jgi:hypothetical protein
MVFSQFILPLFLFALAVAVTQNRKSRRFPLIFISAIIFIATFFPYQVYLENALTLKPETDFEIQISPLRIVLEPLLGSLLFLNRSLYALDETIVLAFWMLTLFALRAALTCVLLKEKKRVTNYLVKQLLLLPILIGLWFSLLVSLLFLPLSLDRIVNKSKNRVLVATHAHTEYSHDGLISQENLWKWHKKNGFDAFFITEHNNHDQTLSFVDQQRQHKFPSHPAVFCGEEFSGSNHLSLLGLKSNFNTRGLSDSTVIARARVDSAAVIVNHWFEDERNSLAYYKDLGVDGFEIENTAKDKRYPREIYRQIKIFCEKHGLIMNGGLDFHGYANGCTLWNVFEIPGWEQMDFQSKESSILTIIKNRDQSKLSVLLLHDRPYYEKKHLFLSPIRTLYTYFRTLQFPQLLSWTCWILIFHYLHLKIQANRTLLPYYAPSRILPIIGILYSLFILILGLIYLGRIQHRAGFTELYAEYSLILLIVGTFLLILSGLATKFITFNKHLSS